MLARSRLLLLSLLAFAGCATVVDTTMSSTTTTADPPPSVTGGSGGSMTTTTSSGDPPGTGGHGGGAPCTTWSWTRGGPWYDAVNLVVTDPASGDILVAGDYTDTVDSGMGPVESVNGWNAFLARFTASGEPIWSRTFGGKWSDEITSLAIDDASGDIVISGQFDDTISFGGPPLTTTSQFTMFLARLDADGNHRWSRSFGYPVSAQVAIDAAGDIVLAGNFMHTLDLGGAPLVATTPSDPWSIPVPDVFIAKLTATGEHVWSKRFGSPSVEEIDRVAVAPDGAIIVAGAHADADLDFGGGPLPFNTSMAVFLAAFDAAGNHLWSKGFNGPDMFTPDDSGSPIDARALAVTSGGDIILAGDFEGVTDFGAGPLSTPDPLDRNLFVARFDAAGGVLWTRQFADQSGAQYIEGATLDGAESFTFTGRFHGSVDFGGGTLLSTNDGYDIFVVELDAAGNHVWSAAYGGAGLDGGTAVAIDAAGDLLLGGAFSETLSLGCTSLTSVGDEDGFVTRIER
jgi:hypothetical protein